MKNCVNLGSATPPIYQESGVLWLRNFWGSPVFMPKLNAERPNSAWYHVRRGGRVFGRSSTPLHLHKCVARFVSDSQVSSVCLWTPAALGSLARYAPPVPRIIWRLDRDCCTVPFAAVVASRYARQRSLSGYL